MSDKVANEQPFKIRVPQEDLEQLYKKLDLVRYPDELTGAGWDYGVPLADLKRLTTYWKSGFDWRKTEAELNRLPMFTRDIEVEGFGTLNIHYVHQKSHAPNAIPLLLVHGWPGLFMEVRKMLPLLTASSPDHPGFHVVAPSLPGWGFSEAPKKPGFKGPQYAEVLNKLMLSLGYEEYVYQGGDWGHVVGTVAVKQYGHKHLKAIHTNTPFAGPPSPWKHPLLWLGMILMFLLPFDKASREGLLATGRFFTTGSGYMAQQSTRPQTLGYGLTDSPAGLLAWLYEKLVAFSDKYPWSDDEVLEWVSIYWFSCAGPAASTMIYYEMTNGNTLPMGSGAIWLSVPLGVSFFDGDIMRMPKSWASMMGKLVFQAAHEKGGHFPGIEQPEALVSDLRKMFGKGGPAFGVVPGKDGY
ncbi:epoxide hydrolase [Daedaleopsis nitida]|nr:epoxide hydrolase [Daedaleopsis nitida]